MKQLITSFFIAIIFVFYGCKNDNIEEQNIKVNVDSLQELNNKRRFDSIGMIADFITNSGGRLTTKETSIIYETDTNIVGNLVNLGITLIEDGKINDAFKCLNKALRKDKSFAPLIYFNKGIAWRILKEEDSSYYYYDKAIIEDSINVKYLVFRSLAYSEDSLFQKAVHDMNKAIKIDPNNLSLRVTRGHYKIALNDFDGAVIDLQEVPAVMKRNDHVYRDRALVLLILGAYIQSIEQCNISLNINPKYGNVYGIRAAAKSNLYDFKGAYEDFKKAVSLGDKESLPYLKQLKVYYETHKQI